MYLFTYYILHEDDDDNYEHGKITLKSDRDVRERWK